MIRKITTASYYLDLDILAEQDLLEQTHLLEELVRAQQRIHIADTGLATSYLQYDSYEDLSVDLRGRLFETNLVNNIIATNQYSDNKYEVDFVIADNHQIIGIEIKSGINVSSKWFSGLIELSKMAKQQNKKFVGIVIYAGEHYSKTEIDGCYIVPATWI